jgi:hypothetical protein
MTRPLLCKGADGKSYYAKGKRATASGLIKEWMVANLARAFGLPIPDFQIAYIERSLVEGYGSEAVENLGVGDVFVSEQIKSATDFKYHILKKTPLTLQQDILLFDLWVENSDRTLSEDSSGNPNLIWGNDEGKLYVIDHNLAFDHSFDKKLFWETHVCRSEFLVYQSDVEMRLSFQNRLEEILQDWPRWWSKIPDTWKEQNEDSKLFNPEVTLQRLKVESQGAIWSKWL